MPLSKQTASQQLPPPSHPPANEQSGAAVDDNEWGLDEAGIEEVFSKLQTPPRPPVREATVLPPGQVELTENDRLCLARIQQREAEGRTRKVTRSSEFHPAVVGHNKSEQKQTHRLLRQWYFEQRYQLDKVSNAQRATYRQLRTLHVDRRRQMRELMNYRREEARAEVERDRERLQRAKELALLERQLERLRQEEAMEQRLSSPDQQAQPPRKTNKASKRIDAAVAAVAAAASEATEEKAAEETAEKPPLESLPSNQQDATTQEKIVTVTAKVVEVERRGMRAMRQGSEEMAVLERSRSKSFIREPTGTGIKASQQEQPFQPLQPESQAPQPQPQQQQQPPPSPVSKQQPPPAQAKEKKVSIAAAAGYVDEEEQPLPPLTERRAPLTQVERNQLRAKRREEASKRLLLEPYTHYRMSKDGKIEPVEFQPPKFPTTEPSNRPLYEQHKRLEREKACYVSSMNRLGQFTAQVLNESIRLADAFEQQKEKPSKSGPPKELRLGPSDWMKVFIRTNAPEEVEAGSFEAMKYIEYLRPDAPNTNRELEPEKLFEDT